VGGWCEEAEAGARPRSTGPPRTSRSGLVGCGRSTLPWPSRTGSPTRQQAGAEGHAFQNTILNRFLVANKKPFRGGGDEGAEQARAQVGKARRWKVDTINGTIGKAALDYLASPLCEADAVCIQEVAVTGEKARAMELGCKTRGWRVAVNDSCVTRGGAREGVSAGTAVGARKGWGTCLLPGEESTVLVEHRVSAMHWMALAAGGVDVVSVYLKSGEGPS
jgi:hypothetical protein